MPLTLRDGSDFPALGFGCGTSFTGRHDAVVEGVALAWECGFRFFDTAQFYHTERAVGDALHKIMRNGAKREDFKVMTKINSHLHNTYETVMSSFEKSLKDLQLDYVDYLLDHSAGPYVDLKGVISALMTDEQAAKLPRTPQELKHCRLEIWRALQDLKAQGKVKHIGVSNYRRFHLEQLIADPVCKEIPEINQIEMHPYLQDNDIVSCCRENGILVQAYSPLGNGKRPKRFVNTDKYVLYDPVIREVAEETSCTPAQVCLIWLRKKNIAVVTKSESKDRLTENLASASIELADRNLRKIDGITFRQRLFPDPYTLM